MGGQCRHCGCVNYGVEQGCGCYHLTDLEYQQRRHPQPRQYNEKEASGCSVLIFTVIFISFASALVGGVLEVGFGLSPEFSHGVTVAVFWLFIFLLLFCWYIGTKEKYEQKRKK